jgi:hypothetical protein
MRNVAGAASHVQSCVAAAPLRNIDANLVAAQAEIFILVFAFRRLEQLILVRRTVRIVALGAIADSGLMNMALDRL